MDRLGSMSTIPVRGKVLKFVGWIDHPDADAHPVHVEVWADGKSVFDGDLKRTDVIRVDIPARDGQKLMVLISRSAGPSDRATSAAATAAISASRCRIGSGSNGIS